MGMIIVRTGTLSKEEQYDLGKLLLKCGYEVQIGKRDTKSGKAVTCITYDAKEEESK